MAGIYRKLIKSFTKFTGFDGWMIAKAEFKIIKQAGNIYTKDDNTALYMPDIKNSIVKQRKSYSVILAGMVYKGIAYSFIMHLIKPVEINFARDGFKQVEEVLPSYVSGSVYLFSLNYSKPCIKKFTEYIGDDNYIHQTERPVVPGLLVFEDVLEKEFCISKGYAYSENFTIVFKKPVLADEVINLYKTKDNRIFAMPSQGHKCILWELGYI